MRPRTAAPARPEARAVAALRELVAGIADPEAGGPSGQLARHDPGRALDGLRMVLLGLEFLRHAAARGLLERSALAGVNEEAPCLDDAVIQQARARLLAVDDGTLPAVEELGATYAATIGYTLVRAVGPSLALRPHDRVVELAALVSQPPGDRTRWLFEQVGCSLSRSARLRVERAEGIMAMIAALGRRISPRAPRLVPPCWLYLQPGPQRRRSGSHYTPRALSGPIVEVALRPVLAALGERATPAQILALKVCDPALGCGALLVEACRQLAARLVRAWDEHGYPPGLTREAGPGQARRLIARHCLYGVDSDPLAVMLARRSLWLVASGGEESLDFVDHALRCGDSLLPPFVWESEFPAVFAGDDPGFDVVVSNPPFLAGRGISAVHGPTYLERLLSAYPGTAGGADLSAYFFRRAFALLRAGGTAGLVATNTVAQGVTRESGLQWICEHGGTIYSAQRRTRWPDTAAVVVSVVHLIRDRPATRPVVLDGVEVARISAHLDRAADEVSPRPIAANAGKSFQGCIVLGSGFLFADDEPGATPIAVMQRLIQERPDNAARIFPYLGGAALNASPTHAPGRHVIHFGELSEAEARRWPELLAIVEARVKPERARKSPAIAAWPWWRFWRARPELTAAMRGLSRVLVCSRHQPHWCLAFVPAGAVFSEALIVFTFAEAAALAILQSRVHEVWARRFGSSMKDDLRYTPSGCFETFPFPPAWRERGELERLGSQYQQYRADLMIRRQEGLTRLYNRFHDPDEREPAIAELRQLHAAIDRAVLTAYGWTDLAAQATCEFGLDYDESAVSPRGRARKRPWRHRWPQALHDEVLSRLLALNARIVKEEAGR